MKTHLSSLFFTFLMVFSTTAFSQTQPDPSKTEELRMRSGLPNFFSKIDKGENINVGFIGGSITAGGDTQWSGKVFNWLKAEYTNSTFEKTNVAVPGTSADFGAFRIGSKMLVHNPDLVFIEYRVNGLGRQGYKGPEGMVRQILRKNPNTDICIVYTVSQWMIETIRNGNQTAIGKVIEETANHYDIPSIDMGIEVVKLLDEDKLIFKGNTAVVGKILFTKDGTHPLEAGAEIYKDVVVRNLKKMEANKTPLAKSLPNPLDDLSIEDGTIHTINETTKSNNWVKMNPDTDAIYRTARWRSVDVLGDAFKTTQLNETISFDWKGYALAMTTIPQGTGMAIEVVTDGLPAKEYTFTQSGSRFGTELFYTPFLEDGNHTTTITVTQLPTDASFYFGQYYTAKKHDGSLSFDGVSSKKEDLIFYPNPVKNYLKINLDVKTTAFTIYNSMGATVLKGKLEKESTIDVRSLSKGIYLLKIGDRTARFIKN